MRIDILGCGFDNITADEAVSYALDLISSRQKEYIVTPNPEIVWMARRDEALSAAVNGAALVLPDGIGIIHAARILGTPLCEKIPGIDFVAALFNKMAGSGGSVFLFGAKPGVAEEAGLALVQSYPGLVIAGTADGYFADEELVIEQINSANPDLLLVCLGAPKQELWMREKTGLLNAGLCAGLGGSLDIFAGKTKRAPAFYQRFGLEWFYRLIREPRRIKRMIKLPLFILTVIGIRIRGEKHG